MVSIVVMCLTCVATASLMRMINYLEKLEFDKLLTTQREIANSHARMSELYKAQLNERAKFALNSLQRLLHASLKRPELNEENITCEIGMLTACYELDFEPEFLNALPEMHRTAIQEWRAQFNYWLALKRDQPDLSAEQILLHDFPIRDKNPSDHEKKNIHNFRKACITLTNFGAKDKHLDSTSSGINHTIFDMKSSQKKPTNKPN